ncbi:DnaT-like ssDNA-binding domain-containing protein [Oceanospirillum beijerinckii]|uniref:DnaT-like ssDNA-binding domain-containing protein n=1 Tax=Oceanospirillum beijerinckii TaxID=64976 RepID=UPI000409DC65|nr:DnaT-like ssDNA-binding domain-containing protein [Oceanospirillum beijerinckii]
MSIALITTLLERTIAFHPVFRDVAGSTVGGVFLSQAYYWSTGGRIAAERAGWFYKTGTQWTEETRLSRSEQERARRDLKAVGLLEERRQGRPAKLFFRLNLDRLFELILEFAQGKPALKKPKKNTSLQDSAILAGSEEKANKINSMQDSANYAQPEPAKSPDLPEKANEIHSLQDSAFSMQDSASQFAESCKLYTEITTENTSEITNVGDNAREVADPFSPPVDTRPRFTMPLDGWQPSENFMALCKRRGLDLPKLFDQQSYLDLLSEFCCYWNTRPHQPITQGEWENKLVQRVMRVVRDGRSGAMGQPSKEFSHAAQSRVSSRKSASAILAESCAGAFSGAVDQSAGAGGEYAAYGAGGQTFDSNGWPLD